MRTESDLKLRIKFGKDIKKYYDNGLRSSGICFYLDDEHRTPYIEQIQWIRQRLQKVWSTERKLKVLLGVLLQREIKYGMAAAKWQVFCCYITWKRDLLLQAL